MNFIARIFEGFVLTVILICTTLLILTYTQSEKIELMFCEMAADNAIEEISCKVQSDL